MSAAARRCSSSRPCSASTCGGAEPGRSAEPGQRLRLAAEQPAVGQRLGDGVEVPLGVDLAGGRGRQPAAGEQRGHPAVGALAHRRPGGWSGRGRRRARASAGARTGSGSARRARPSICGSRAAIGADGAERGGRVEDCVRPACRASVRSVWSGVRSVRRASHCEHSAGVSGSCDARAGELGVEEPLHERAVVHHDDRAVEPVEELAGDVGEGRGAADLDCWRCRARTPGRRRGRGRRGWRTRRRPGRAASTRAIAISTIRSPLAGENPVVAIATTANGASTSKPGPSPPYWKSGPRRPGSATAIRHGGPARLGRDRAAGGRDRAPTGGRRAARLGVPAGGGRPLPAAERERHEQAQQQHGTGQRHECRHDARSCVLRRRSRTVAPGRHEPRTASHVSIGSCGPIRYRCRRRRHTRPSRGGQEAEPCRPTRPRSRSRAARTGASRPPVPARRSTGRRPARCRAAGCRGRRPGGPAAAAAAGRSRRRRAPRR